MKKLLFIILLLFSLNSFSQPKGHFARQPFNHDFSNGNIELTTGKFLGFSRLSFQLVTTGFDAADATIQIQKSNDLINYLDIVGATLTFNSGNNINFIEIENAKNDKYKIILTVNSLTTGIIDITLTATR